MKACQGHQLTKYWAFTLHKYRKTSGLSPTIPTMCPVSRPGVDAGSEFASFIIVSRLTAKWRAVKPGRRCVNAPRGQRNLKAFHRRQPLGDKSCADKADTLSGFGHVFLRVGCLLVESLPLSCSAIKAEAGIPQPRHLERGMQLDVCS